MRKSKRPRPRGEWEALVAEWRRSGLPRREFARRHGLAPATLTWWASRLRRERRQADPALVPVRLLEEPPVAEFVVRLCTGRSVVVPASFDPEALRRIVTVLEEPAC